MAELTAVSSRKGRAMETFLNFYVSHGSDTRRHSVNVHNVTVSL